MDGLRAVPRRTWVGVVIVLGLWWIFMHYTRWPAVQGKSELLTVLASGAPNTFTELVSRDGWPYWLSWIPTGINMNDNNAVGMAFAFLIGGAVTSLVLPQKLIDRLLLARGAKGASFGGLLGAPLMMCSACSVPVALGWKKRGANLETTLGVVMGAALLNVMGLMTIFVLFPGPLGWGRLLASGVMVGAFTPLMVYLARRFGIARQLGSAGMVDAVAEETACSGDTAASSQSGERWKTAIRGAFVSWWWASVDIAYRLFLPMTGAIFLAALIRLFVPPSVVESTLGGGVLAIVLVSFFGTFIAVPTLFEIPLTMGFLFLGMGFGPAAALLVTAPSVSIVSYFMLRKDVGHGAPLLLMGATFIIGILTGLGVEVAMTVYG